MTVFKKAGYKPEFEDVTWKRAIIDERKVKFNAIVLTSIFAEYT